MEGMDYRELILFLIAVFGCVFGIYQWVHKNLKDSSKELKEDAVTNAITDTVVMTKLDHISEKVDEIKSDVKTMKDEHRHDRKEFYGLMERHKNLESKVDTAFTKIDELRKNKISRVEFDALKEDVQELKNSE